MSGEQSRRIVLGRITAPYGVQGWVRAVSYTDPQDNLLRYRVLLVGRGGEWNRLTVAEGRVHGRWLLIGFDGVTDRDMAAALAGSDLAVPRSALPPTEDGEYYWADLIGLEVVTKQGRALGRVRRLVQVTEQTLLVVDGDRERLIPVIRGKTVMSVDLERGVMEVDWDVDF